MYFEGPYEVSSETSSDGDAKWDYKGLAKRHRYVDSGLPCDPMFCAASLVVELGGQSLFKLLCQLALHLVQAFEASACPLGLMMFKNHFTRLYYVGGGNFFYEVPNPKLWGQTFSLMDVKTHFGDRNDYCAYELGTPSSGNNFDPEALDAIRQTLCAAVTRLACLPFQGVTYDDLKKRAVPEWLFSDEGLRCGSHGDQWDSPVAESSGQADLGDDVRKQHLEVDTVDAPSTQGVVRPIPSSPDIRHSKKSHRYNLGRGSWWNPDAPRLVDLSSPKHDAPSSTNSSGFSSGSSSRFSGHFYQTWATSFDEGTNMPHERLPGNVHVAEISQYSAAGETDQNQDDPEVWWDPQDDIDNTPARDYPVYCALEHMCVRLKLVSPQKMTELVAEYSDSSILSRA